MRRVFVKERRRSGQTYVVGRWNYVTRRSLSKSGYENEFVAMDRCALCAAPAAHGSDIPGSNRRIGLVYKERWKGDKSRVPKGRF